MLTANIEQTSVFGTAGFDRTPEPVLVGMNVAFFKGYAYGLGISTALWAVLAFCGAPAYSLDHCILRFWRIR